MEGVSRMLQAKEPDTVVLATGRATSVREFVQLSFQILDIHVSFKGQGEQEICFDEKDGRQIVWASREVY